MLAQIDGGGTYTAFDGEGRPVAGETAAGVDFTITYAADGSSVQRFDDGSSVSFDPGGTVVSQTTVDGATFTPSDGGGQPADGLTAGENSFATSHGDGSSDGPTGDGTAVSDYPSATTEVETPAAATAPATGRGGNGTFQVDLAALGSAIGGVSGQRDAIDGGLSTLRTTFSNIEQVWQSPSGATFSNLVTDFNAASDELLSLLRESIDRMRSAHATYSATEATNVRNLQ